MNHLRGLGRLALALSMLVPVQLPSLPPLPPPPIDPPCILPPICPPDPLPLPSDDPPVMGSIRVVERGGGRITIAWERATDDIAIAGYRIYRDSSPRQIRSPATLWATLRLPCGRHSYRVEAVDSAGQTASKGLTVRRAC